MIFEKDIFYTISLLSVYIYKKENNIEHMNHEHFKDLKSSLISLSKYTHLKNKDKTIENCYEKILSCCDEKGRVDEEKLFEAIPDSISTLEENDKRYILNSIIYVALQDKNISDNEKELILQTRDALGFSDDINTILKEFKNSEFSPSLPLKYIVLLISILIIITTLIVYYLYENNNNKVNIFSSKEKIVFNTISFNRYSVYKNKFTNVDKHFLKQAVFYFGGTAEIGINTKNIAFNQMKKTITIYQDYFDIDMDFINVEEIDTIDPRELSEKEIQIVSAVIGLAGAATGGVIGAKAGGLISHILPPPYNNFSNLIGGTVGATTGGAISYFLAEKALDGLTLTEKISKEEKEIVKDKSKDLIKSILLTDIELNNMYKENCKKYLKSKYTLAGYEINEVIFKEKGEK